jgi:DNA-binding response OmpR family regulator
MCAFLAKFSRIPTGKEDALQYDKTLTEEHRGAQAGGSRVTILIIEDDPSMQKLLERTFRERGYAVTACGEGRAGLGALRAEQPAAVMLDLMLPDIIGRDLCKLMKAERPETPVIVLSAISDVANKVLLLESGADDYVTKPFSPRELIARVERALKRPWRAVTTTAAYTVGECEIDFVKMTAHRTGKPLALTAHAFKLLKYFLDNAERVLSREELLNKVWGYERYPTTRTVDNQILKLRQNLEPDSTEPRYLQTVHGVGYKFVP